VYGNKIQTQKCWDSRKICYVPYLSKSKNITKFAHCTKDALMGAYQNFNFRLYYQCLPKSTPKKSHSYSMSQELFNVILTWRWATFLPKFHIQLLIILQTVRILLYWKFSYHSQDSIYGRMIRDLQQLSVLATNPKIQHRLDRLRPLASRHSGYQICAWVHLTRIGEIHVTHLCSV
jgi:hypothetical protein